MCRCAVDTHLEGLRRAGRSLRLLGTGVARACQRRRSAHSRKHCVAEAKKRRPTTENPAREGAKNDCASRIGPKSNWGTASFFWIVSDEIPGDLESAVLSCTSVHSIITQDPHHKVGRSWIRRLLRILGTALRNVIEFLLISWASLAIYYSNLPWASTRFALAAAFGVF